MNMHDHSAHLVDVSDENLIKLCNRAKRLLEVDRRLTHRRVDVEDELMTREPPRPLQPRSALPERSAAEMRKHLREALKCNTEEVLDAYRARIDVVVLYEAECRRLKKEIGVAQAQSASDRASARARPVVAEVASTRAMTLEGLACKATILTLWKRAGYGLHDEGEDLAYAIASDARLIGTEVTTRHASRRRHVTRDESRAAL